ncbi:MAG: hypothetical protein LAP87_31040 [Acidobacteriia bacterium]|nr:hypothetical protein [Terriglobia bacterium]
MPVAEHDFGCGDQLLGGEIDLKKATLDPAREFVHESRPSRAWPKLKDKDDFAMAKRKKSTFERLRSGETLRRWERKQLDRQFQAEEPGWEVVHRNVLA